jgi:hypothetical protein
LLACKISNNFLLPKSMDLPRAYALSDPTKRKTNCTAAEAEMRHFTVTTLAGIPQWDYFASNDGTVGVDVDCAVPAHPGNRIQISKAVVL